MTTRWIGSSRLDLAVHHDPAQGTVVLTLRGREVVHWRDYLDPIAVFDALGWPPR